MTTSQVRVSAVNRPGVFVNQTAAQSLPQPLANHAIGYIFGTTPAEEYYADASSSSIYSSLEPYKPTQISSVEDYLNKIGGVVPTGNSGALVTYDSVKAFFDNVGVNGILYYTRVSPTPETTIDLSNSGAGAGYNAFALKVNGRYYGTPIGIEDVDGTEIRVIVTTALDVADNARDLYNFLSAPSSQSDSFSDFYRVEQNATEALGAKLRFYSKDTRSLPKVEAFFAYQFSDTQYSSPLNLNTSQIVKNYASVKQLDFRCVSRDTNTGEGILFLSGAQLSLFIAAANAATPGTYAPATDQSDIIVDFLVDQDIYASAGGIPDNKYIAVSRDLSSGVGSGDKWRDQDAAYWQYDLGTTSFAKVVSGPNALVPTGTISVSGNSVTRSGYLPDSVQVFYVNVAGENRAIIVNGSTPDELATELRNEIVSILEEKELDVYYDVEVVPTGSNTSGNTYAPNNGHVVSTLVSAAGTPYIRPDLGTVARAGTIAISGGNITGSGTQFLSQLGVGDIIVANGVRFAITAISSDTAATTSVTTVTIPAGTTYSLDESIPNGFYSFDYVLRLVITSKNGVMSPVLPGKDRFGTTDSNVAQLTSLEQNPGYKAYKLTQTAKSYDFVYAIEQGMSSRFLSPGFLLAPEAYAVLTYDVNGGPTSDLNSKTEARLERIKITQALTRAAEGRTAGNIEGITDTQHVALIDCGGDESTLTDIQDELNLLKSTVGVPFGHAAFYAPWVKNASDRFVPPSGYVAGISCSRYITEGFQAPPAGVRYPLRGVNGLKIEISAQQQEVTYALGLNPIRSLPNRGIVVYGARTLSSNPLFRFVNTRVILNVLIDVLNRSFDDILFEAIDSAGTVYSRIRSISDQVLNQFWRQGALFGSRPEQAYRSICSSANNDAVSLEEGTVNLGVFVATSPTQERIFITVTRTPIGQVVQISDSFSRNTERFTAFLGSTNL